jgi:ribA/ribD-fused uncharacterized protein
MKIFVAGDKNISKITQFTHMTAREAFNESKKLLINHQHWTEQRNNVMYNILLLKFTQDYHLENLLLSTGSRELIENSPLDNYWGVGPNGDGQNMLGKLLIELRGNIRNRALNQKQIYNINGSQSMISK